MCESDRRCKSPSILRAQRPHALPSGYPIWGPDMHVYQGDSLGVCVNDLIGPHDE